MNHIDPVRVRRLLACPDIPEARFAELREASIEWPIVPLTGWANPNGKP
jgi:hypothetical protein